MGAASSKDFVSEDFVSNRVKTSFSKKNPSTGYNFSQNSTFEASNQQNIAVNNKTTGIADSKSQIKNNWLKNKITPMKFLVLNPPNRYQSPHN